MELTELDPEKVYEWVIMDSIIREKNGRTFLHLEFGNVEVPDLIVAAMRFQIISDLKDTVLLSIMRATGYQDNGSVPDFVTHFKRGNHIFAKPIKLYRNGNLRNIYYTLAPDTITGQRIKVELSQNDRETISRVISSSPDFDEVTRRLGKLHPNLLFSFGVAVGAGVMDKTGKLTS